MSVGQVALSFAKLKHASKLDAESFEIFAMERDYKVEGYYENNTFINMNHFNEEQEEHCVRRILANDNPSQTYIYSLLYYSENRAELLQIQKDLKSYGYSLIDFGKYDIEEFNQKDFAEVASKKVTDSFKIYKRGSDIVEVFLTRIGKYSGFEINIGKER